MGFLPGLWALLAVAPLVAAYFLRRKQRPRVVSALFLWRTPDPRAEAGPRFERFSKEASLLLECLAVVAAALYLADVRFGKDAPQKHVVVVVDGGLSMAARAGGRSGADKVRDALAALVEKERAGTLTVVESGPAPRLLAGPRLEPSRALGLLEVWQPLQPAHDVEPALRMAQELGEAGQQVWFFTDGPPPQGFLPPSYLQGRSLGQAAPNLAFVSAQRRDVGGNAQLTLRVANFSDAPGKAAVRLKGEGVDRTETVAVPAGGTSALRVGLAAKGPLEVTLPDDALVEDGRLVLLPAPEEPLAVGLLPGLEPAAEAALRRVLRVATGVRLGDGAQLTFGPPGSRARVTLGTQGAGKSFVGPFFAQKGHPLLEDVGLEGAVWTAGATAPPGRPLLTAGEVVLASEEEDGALHLNLDLARSNLARTTAWPVLASNVLRRARAEAPGLPRRHLMLGEPVPVVAEPGHRHALLGPQGKERTIHGSGAVTLPPLPLPGRWVLRRDGEEVDALVVLPLDARESDLRGRGPWQTDAAVGGLLAGLAPDGARPLWPLALLLLLLLVDFWLTARSRAQ